MARCSFLSTYKNRVSCFEECPFYDCEENNGECPFKMINRYGDFEKEVYYSDFFKKQSINLLDELYEEKNCLEMFQSV